MSSAASSHGDSTTNVATRELASASRVVVVVNVAPGSDAMPLPLPARELLTEALRELQPGGLLFLYGRPVELPGWGEYLLTAPVAVEQVVFKYWIALDLNERSCDGFLVPAHQGLLLFVKRNPARKTPPPFQLHVSDVRVPHRDCTACGENVKD